MTIDEIRRKQRIKKATVLTISAIMPLTYIIIFIIEQFVDKEIIHGDPGVFMICVAWMMVIGESADETFKWRRKL